MSLACTHNNFRQGSLAPKAAQAPPNTKSIPPAHHLSNTPSYTLALVQHLQSRKKNSLVEKGLSTNTTTTLDPEKSVNMPKNKGKVSRLSHRHSRTFV